MATAEQRKAFIEKIAPLVVKYAKQYGYHVASPIIAQACCESNYGTSPSGEHNYFGMKCGGAWKGRSVNLLTKEEYTPGVLTNISDNFRCYDSFEEGVEGYFKFINWSHYANLKTTNNPQTYCEYLKKDGYATDGDYVSNLMNFIKSDNLTRFDFEEQPKVVVINKPVIIYNMRGEAVAKMQRALIAKGYSCGAKGADGIYGQATKNALGAYQADHTECGSVDFKCGPKTWASLLN